MCSCDWRRDHKRPQTQKTHQQSLHPQRQVQLVADANDLLHVRLRDVEGTHRATVNFRCRGTGDGDSEVVTPAARAAAFSTTCWDEGQATSSGQSQRSAGSRRRDRSNRQHISRTRPWYTCRSDTPAAGQTRAHRGRGVQHWPTSVVLDEARRPVVHDVRLDALAVATNVQVISTAVALAIRGEVLAVGVAGTCNEWDASTSESRPKVCIQRQRSALTSRATYRKHTRCRRSPSGSSVRLRGFPCKRRGSQLGRGSRRQWPRSRSRGRWLQ